MLNDSITLMSGADISNMVVASGTVFPSSPDTGEMFYNTTNSKLYVYDGATWNITGATSKADGITWTYQPFLAATTWAGTYGYTIAWNGSQFIAGGQAGKVATSPDGINWTYDGTLLQTGYSTSDVNAIIFDGTKCVAGGTSGFLATL